MPRIIRYYLAEDPILPNVETRICREPDGLAYTLDHLHELVVKPVAESGGYGLIIGPHATKAQIEEFRARLQAHPDNYISQPGCNCRYRRPCANTELRRVMSICDRSR